MIFKNTETTARNKFLRLILMAVFAALAVIIGSLKQIDQFAPYNSRFFYLGILLLVYIVYNIYRYKKKLYYIYYSDLNGLILFRFYHVTMFSKNYKAYEISQKDFHSYEIIKSGIKHLLILKASVNNKIIEYPAISISSLKEGEIFAIKSSLDKFKTY